VASSSSGYLGNRYGAVGAVGRVALGLVGLLFAFQIVARLLYRLVPTTWLVRLALTLDEPIRRQFLQPIVLARRIGLKPGMRVLHLSPGDGPLTEALANSVGSGGRVEALALDEDRLQKARVYLAQAGLENASVGPGRGTHLPFEDESFDAACLVSALGRIPDRARALAEVRRVLRPAGRFSASDVISDPTYLLQSALEKLGESAGFEHLEHFGDVIAYTVNFRKPRAPAGPPFESSARG
jgi:SAM-dependent methyltransferase